MNSGNTVKVNMIYEDNHVLVVEKPVNIPVQKDESKDVDLLTILKDDLKERYEKPGNVYLGLVHRLDRPVGGVMVFAKTSKAASRLSDQVRLRKFGKVYLAVVHGGVDKKKGTLEDYLLKDSKTNIVSVVKKSVQGAKQAVLDFCVIKECDGFSLVRINLNTGRSHQIRVQFSNYGHPLYGDQKYGQSLNKPGQQIALWSHEIIFDHPVTKKEMRFTSKPPMDKPWIWF